MGCLPVYADMRRGCYPIRDHTQQTRGHRSIMAKRMNGQGSVFKDSVKGGWIGLLYVDGRRRKVRAQTKTDVLAKLDTLKRADADGIPVGRRQRHRRPAARPVAHPRARQPRRRPATPSTCTPGRCVSSTTSSAPSDCAGSTVDHIEKGLDRIATGRRRPRLAAVAALIEDDARPPSPRRSTSVSRRKLIPANPARMAELHPDRGPGRAARLDPTRGRPAVGRVGRGAAWAGCSG